MDDGFLLFWDVLIRVLVLDFIFSCSLRLMIFFLMDMAMDGSGIYIPATQRNVTRCIYVCALWRDCWFVLIFCLLCCRTERAFIGSSSIGSFLFFSLSDLHSHSQHYTLKAYNTKQNGNRNHSRIHQ